MNASAISSNPQTSHVIREFHRIWGTLRPDQPPPPIFPGPQPISIERRHFPILQNGNYVVCEKTDGVRHALFCLNYEGKNIAFLINRALKLTPVKMCFPKRGYLGTLLDGELVDGKLFMIYDAMMIYGENIMNKTLPQRLSEADMFVKGIMCLKSDRIIVKMKSLKKISEFDPNQQFPYKTDGLIFTPVEEPVRVGTHETMFKWKPRDMNTIDFQVKSRGPNEWGLYIQDRGTLIYQSSVYGPPDEWLQEDNILECQYQIDAHPVPWWKPVGIRTDKKHPNNRRTYFRTLVNIREDIKDSELLSK